MTDNETAILIAATNLAQALTFDEAAAGLNGGTQFYLRRLQEVLERAQHPMMAVRLPEGEAATPPLVDPMPDAYRHQPPPPGDLRPPAG